MLYLSETDIAQLKPAWATSIAIIQETTALISSGEYSQPIKPYLRFKNPSNRIIAMPSYVGGSFDISGIKWVSSFPDNLKSNIPRAHSITILNSADTGEPIAILNSRLLSGIRTAAVSGLMLQKYLSLYPNKKCKVGICGFGVIGKLHFEMLKEILGNQMLSCMIYDHMLNPKDIENPINGEHVQLVESWQEAYQDSDIFIACTTSSSPYINIPPPMGSLQLNISLRDYTSDILMLSKHIVVDDWDEVCRENTDVYRSHLQRDLQKEQTYSLTEIISKKLDLKELSKSSFLHFNPMGMSVFDISLAKAFYTDALKMNLGTVLNKEYTHVSS